VRRTLNHDLSSSRTYDAAWTLGLLSRALREGRRYTLVRTMEILRKYCLNDNPVKLQVLSDQAANFPTKCARRRAHDWALALFLVVLAVSSPPSPSRRRPLPSTPA
jgi:hypothetical protein